jgi:hypothetical protein
LPLPRQRSTPPNLIDLTDFYNTALAETWESFQTGWNLAEFPAGVQTFAGVKFDVRGAVRLSDHDGALLEYRYYPSRVVGIPIGQRCRRLHFLHGSEGSPSNVFETKLGSYVVHYANHQQWEITIEYGRDVRDWFTQPGEDESASRAEIAWQGHNVASRRTGQSLHLYKRTWDNPTPDLEIESIDFILNTGPSLPFLLAITAE